MKWSNYQTAAFDLLAAGTGDGILRARAGAGKTTVLVEGVARIPPHHSVLIAAFNRRIMEEMTARVTQQGLARRGLKISTTYGIGYGRILRALGLSARELAVQANDEVARTRVDRILEELGLGLTRFKKPVRARASDDSMSGSGNGNGDGEGEFLDTRSLAALSRACKLRLTTTPEAVCGVLDGSDIFLQEVDKDVAVSVTCRVLQESVDPLRFADGRRVIDFADQLWIPICQGLPGWPNDLVLVDEAQDLSPAQQMLLRTSVRPGGRLVVAGDDRQWLYGFAAADLSLMDTTKTRAGAFGPPTDLLLPVSYRCPRAVVEVAQTWVPDIEAAPGAPAGSVEDVDVGVGVGGGNGDGGEDEGTDVGAGAVSLLRRMQPGDFVLSRTNAPLGWIASELRRLGTPAVVLGTGDATLVAAFRRLVRRSNTVTAAALLLWLHAEAERVGQMTNPARRQTAIDQVDALRGVTLSVLNKDPGARTDTVLAEVAASFGDAPPAGNPVGGMAGGPAVTCSTVHRAKGLEAARVWWLEDTARRSGLEEDNVRYVAVTRARQTLFRVHGRFWPYQDQT